MVELCKEILTKVSFDRYLFQKELKKAIKWIQNPVELRQFREWCILEFGGKYPKIIEKTFKVAIA